MNLSDLSRFLWPDGFEGRQPQGSSVRAEISGVPASFLLLPSVGVDDLAGNAAKTVTGTLVRGPVSNLAGSILVTNNSNRVSWKKRTSRDRLTVVFYGYLGAPSTSSGSMLFGQFSPNSTPANSTVYDWGIYESYGTDLAFFQGSDGTNSFSVGPPAAAPWVAGKPHCIAASFNKGVVKISIDGGAVGTTSTAVAQLSSSWDIASGGYVFAQNSYNPGNRTALAATFDDYAARDDELRSLSAKPWSMFVSPVDVGWPVAAGGGGGTDATAPGATLTGTSSISAGSASGGSGGTDATAPGATLTGTSSISAGSASGSGGAAGDATAPGANLSGSSTISAGSATGNQDATAPGATLTGSSSLSAGTASNGTYARAPSGGGPFVIQPNTSRPRNIGGCRC